MNFCTARYLISSSVSTTFQIQIHESVVLQNDVSMSSIGSVHGIQNSPEAAVKTLNKIALNQRETETEISLQKPKKIRFKILPFFRLSIQKYRLHESSFTHFHPNGFYWGHQCSWTLTPTSLGWMGDQLRCQYSCTRILFGHSLLSKIFLPLGMRKYLVFPNANYLFKNVDFVYILKQFFAPV